MFAIPLENFNESKRREPLVAHGTARPQTPEPHPHYLRQGLPAISVKGVPTIATKDGPNPPVH